MNVYYVINVLFFVAVFKLRICFFFLYTYIIYMKRLAHVWCLYMTVIHFNLVICILCY